MRIVSKIDYLTLFNIINVRARMLSVLNLLFLLQ